MNSKERFSAAIRSQEPDRVPFNFWMDRRLLKEYEDRYGTYFRVRHYQGDVIETFALLDWPQGEGIWREGSFWFANPPLIQNWNTAKDLCFYPRVPGICV